MDVALNATGREELGPFRCHDLAVDSAADDHRLGLHVPFDFSPGGDDDLAVVVEPVGELTLA